MSIVLNGTTGITAPDIDVTAQTTVAAFDAGITLGGSATTLDDYEEGTWTPTIFGGTVAGTGTYVFQQGRYVKVGELVMLECFVEISGHTGSGQMYVGGFPFTYNPGNTTYQGLAIGETDINQTISGTLCGRTQPNSTHAPLHVIPASGGGVTQQQLDSACYLIFSLSYKAN